jgi:hypothetical protein
LPLKIFIGISEDSDYTSDISYCNNKQQLLSQPQIILLNEDTNNNQYSNETITNLINNNNNNYYNEDDNNIINDSTNLIATNTITTTSPNASLTNLNTMASRELKINNDELSNKEEVEEEEEEEEEEQGEEKKEIDEQTSFNMEKNYLKNANKLIEIRSKWKNLIFKVFLFNLNHVRISNMIDFFIFFILF